MKSLDERIHAGKIYEGVSFTWTMRNELVSNNRRYAFAQNALGCAFNNIVPQKQKAQGIKGMIDKTIDLGSLCYRN